MSAATQLASVFNRIPADLQAPVTFIQSDGVTETSSVAMAEPTSPSPEEGFRDPQTTRRNTLTLWVRGDGLTFAPAAGMYCDWASDRYGVLESMPIGPAGTALHWKVTVQR